MESIVELMLFNGFINDLRDERKWMHFQQVCGWCQVVGEQAICWKGGLQSRGIPTAWRNGPIYTISMHSYFIISLIHLRNSRRWEKKCNCEKSCSRKMCIAANTITMLEREIPVRRVLLYGCQDDEVRINATKSNIHWEWEFFFVLFCFFNLGNYLRRKE